MQAQTAYYEQKLQYEIDAWDLKQAIEKGEDIVVIDARSPEAYQKEHIPSALNFPHRTITPESAKKTLRKETVYVTYCDGIGCNASTKAAFKLAGLGYRVKELIGGIAWWKQDGYATSLKQNASDTDTVESCGCDTS